MFKEKVFQLALLFSFVAHGIILALSPHNGLLPSQKRNKDPEVRYVKVAKEDRQLKTAAAERQARLNIPKKITFDKSLLASFSGKEAFAKKDKALLPQSISLVKPELMKPEVLAIKKKISFPELQTGKISNPSYISYQQITREKIKRAAYQLYTGKEEGKVTVSFVISSEGALEEWKIIDEDSSSSQYLKDTAIASIKAAAAFPPFPQELSYPRLSFNLTIIFEVE